MSEFPSADDNVLVSNKTNPIKPLLDAQCPDFLSWLQNMDITPLDFPYIDNLLLTAYTDWIRQSEGLEWLRKFSTAIFNTGCVQIAGVWENEVYQSCASRVLSSGACERTIEESPGGSRYVVCGVPLFSQVHHDLFAVLLFKAPAQETNIGSGPSMDLLQTAALHYRSVFYQKFESLFIADLLHSKNAMGGPSKTPSILLQLVKRMHDKIEVDAVLDEVFDSISDMFPDVEITLYMAQERQNLNLRVKQLLLDQKSSNVSVKAFVSGQPAVGQMDGREITELGIPLKGKQGTYGVVHLQLPPGQKEMSEMDISLITMMADTAGVAFENANLLEQSNLLIQELRLINELVQRLNQSLQLTDIVHFAIFELMSIFQAENCCIVQLEENGEHSTIIGCNVRAFENRVLYGDSGFSGHIQSTGEPVIVSDYSKESAIVSELMNETGSKSMIGVPLLMSGKVRGSIMLTHTQPYYFSYNNYKLLQMFSTHIGLALMNASLHAQVRRLANMDMLTGLHVRHYLDKVIQEHQQEDFCGSLILIDIDQFKRVNDTFGHQKGDEVLKIVSRIIKDSVRVEDLSARWGGEELAIYLPQLGVYQALQVAETIRKRVPGETDPSVTISCGIAEWSWLDDQVSIEKLFYRADMALYDAKKQGRNRTVLETVDAELMGQIE
ncbi:putative diguanylate cyclase YdaM [compost metagenome]